MILGKSNITFEELFLSDESKGHILSLIESNSIGEKESDILEDYDLIEERPVESVNLAIESEPNESSSLDTSETLVRFKYVGVRDEKNRTFCAAVLDAKLVFRKEDINQMSFRGENKEFGRYSIFQYKGSYGCRHNWLRQVYQRKDSKGKDREITPRTPAQGF
jgi:hypothetical protein